MRPPMAATNEARKIREHRIETIRGVRFLVSARTRDPHCFGYPPDNRDES